MPRKGENIYKRKDGRWEGRYIKSRTETGKPKYGYVYAKTYRDVKAKLRDKTSAFMMPIPAPLYDSDLFITVTKEWLDNIKPQIKESTSNKYQNLLNSYILPTFGEKKLECITYDFIENHCNTLLQSGGKKGTGLSPKTVSDVLSVIRNILKFAIRKGKIVPCDGTIVHIKHASSQMRIFSKTEQEQLCKYLYDNLDSYNIGILLCLFTGLRIGEICALRWEDISFPDQTIHVHHTLQRVQDKTHSDKKTKIAITTPKSACSIRTIPIPDVILKILENHKKVVVGYVLTNSNNIFIEPRTMQNHFKKALKNSNIAPANFHATRHTFATRCIELGFDIKSLSEILGHATVNITLNRYVHPTLELKKENMQKLSSLLAVS